MQTTTPEREAENDAVELNRRPITKEMSIQTVVMCTLKRGSASVVADGVTTGECESKQIRLN